jgi:hypothetical protein
MPAADDQSGLRALRRLPPLNVRMSAPSAVRSDTTGSFCSSTSAEKPTIRSLVWTFSSKEAGVLSARSKSSECVRLVVPTSL